MHEMETKALAFGKEIVLLTFVLPYVAIATHARCNLLSLLAALEIYIN